MDELRDVARPAVAVIAALFCEDATRGLPPCRHHMRQAIEVACRFLSALPDRPINPHDLAEEIRHQSLDA